MASHSHRDSLQPAHRGYLYQDLLTAYVLVRALVEPYDEVIVDRKQTPDDRLDDLESLQGAARIRRQVKHSDQSTRALAFDDFAGAGSTLRIDRLVATYLEEMHRGVSEYRLCATWLPPGPGTPLPAALKPSRAEPTVRSSTSKCYRLDGDFFWPASGPIKPLHLQQAATDGRITRDSFLAFCDLFILELELPSASLDLGQPGALERALIEELVERVGIGRYPNHQRSPADVGALVVSLAARARMLGASLKPAEIERALAIRTDFGRIAQAFPLDKSTFLDRPTLRRELVTEALSGKNQLLIGPPGIGKSWQLTRLAEDFQQAGAIVARHYCYLEPGDEEVERRITTDVFFANIIAEVLDAAPELRRGTSSRYSAGIRELEDLLEHASAEARQVVILVDGLDHIARVRAAASTIATSETDIVERLAALTVPPGVTFVIASQPGAHLTPLKRWQPNLIERQHPPWSLDDLVALSHLHGLTAALANPAVDPSDDPRAVATAIATHADGNPLYARYLTVGLIAAINSGETGNPKKWLAQSPAITGNIARYYEFLYRKSSAEAQAVADVLGAIDFSATESELREMLPPLLRSRVAAALASLAPVLVSATGQGGFRVFHESFRRFMADELVRQGHSLADALSSPIAWLQARGFLRDAKSYRFLLPALRRAGRTHELLDHLGPTFVSDSVAEAHSFEAIHRNLALAADVAARTRDWVALVRCTELHRAAMTSMDESYDRAYWQTYLSLHGPAALAERLLFDGRPTQSRTQGLIACEVVDRAGGTAPWWEYLQLPAEEKGNTPHDSFDDEGAFFESDAVTLATVQGRIRLGQQPSLLRRVYRYLGSNNPKGLFVRRLGERLSELLGPDVVERIASRADDGVKHAPKLPSVLAGALRLGIADACAAKGQANTSRSAATKAIESVETPELAAQCMLRGASPERCRARAVDPQTIDIGVGGRRHLSDAKGVRKWFASIRLLATDIAVRESIFAAELRRIEGRGWYRSWLRFLIRLAQAENAARQGGPTNVVELFGELLHDAHPFLGEPRACDLFPVHRVIRESLNAALSLVRTAVEWRQILPILSRVSSDTGSRMDREDGGPIGVSDVLETVESFLGETNGKTYIAELIEQEVNRAEAMGTYYGGHARLSMCLVAARLARDDHKAAHAAWKKAAQFLTAYGFHKDITLYDLIESAPVLRHADKQTALSSLSQLQPLTDAVVRHTDGRSTKRMPNAWFRSIVEVSPEIAARLLASTILDDGVIDNWSVTTAVQDLCRYVRDQAEPALVAGALSTTPIDIDHESDAAREVEDRLAPLIRWSGLDRAAALEATTVVVAELLNDPGRYAAHTRPAIDSYAAALDIKLEPAASVAPSVEKLGEREARTQPALRVPAFPQHPTIADLLAGLRITARVREWNDPEAWDQVTLSLSYRLAELADSGREEEARRVLRFFARDAEAAYSGHLHPVAKLAEALDNAAYRTLAAFGYALAYARTRGGGGWLVLGGGEHSAALKRAIALDAEVAHQVLAEEVAFAIQGHGYGAGITRHLIERIAEWGEPKTAASAWQAAFRVIEHRLPLAPQTGWFAALNLNDEVWTIEEGLAAIILARVGEPRLRRKNAALRALCHVTMRHGNTLVRPLKWWLNRDAHVTSVLFVLSLLKDVESPPFSITVACFDELTGYSESDIWGFRVLAELLLQRAGLKCQAATGPNELASNATPAPGKDREEALLSLDKQGAIASIDRYWPEARALVVRKLEELLADTKNQRDHFRSRYELAIGRDKDWWPRTPVLMWEEELFAVALHDQMTGLRNHLWTSGSWTPTRERKLLAATLPNLRVHLALAASRCARPPWPVPNESGEGEAPLEVVKERGPYNGWIRLGLVETQYVSADKKSFSRPEEEVRLFAGVVGLDIGREIPPSAFPFTDGNVDDWWPPEHAGVPCEGPLVNCVSLKETLGNAFVLVAPNWLLSARRVRLPQYGGPLAWSDDAGEAVRFRSWRVRNTHAIFGEPVELEGSDLIVRPDIAERLSEFARVPELRVVWRRALAGLE